MTKDRTSKMNENRAYNRGPPPYPRLWMPKHTPPQVDFGQRLAALRKAASYTQQQLAEEIGVSRRVIAYYETESEHPPASLLVHLAQALNITTDALLGLEPVIPASRTSSRLERRLRQIEDLNPKAKRRIGQLIDTFIEAEQIKQAHSDA